jgi:hypothetical protein
MGHRGESSTPTRCQAAGVVGPCRHGFHRGSVSIDFAIAAPVVRPLDCRGGGQCWNCPSVTQLWLSISLRN